MWFYIPTERLVLSSEKIPISIPLAGIKHTMSRRCKLYFQFNVESSVNVAVGLVCQAYVFCDVEFSSQIDIGILIGIYIYIGPI